MVVMTKFEYYNAVLNVTALSVKVTFQLTIILLVQIVITQIHL